MKVLFAGPTIEDMTVVPPSIEVRPPAGFGDLARAVDDGAAAIGLVDGVFGSQAAVWHKEILYALSRGIVVFGSSSMGALRASECARFGMVPVGKIAVSYLTGALDDDAAVALVHGPAELGSPPLTEPLVEAEPTIQRLHALGLVTAAEKEKLLAAARSCFFADRTVGEIIRLSRLGAIRAEELAKQYTNHRVPQKLLDAIELLQHLAMAPDFRSNRPSSFELKLSPMWRQLHPSAATS